MIDVRDLVKHGVHFGHQTSRWCPQMEPYIWGYKDDIHLIDVSKTAFALEQAAKFLEALAGDGRSILWVGTKKAAQGIIGRTAQELNQPAVAHRWVGGTFSNYRQVRKSIAKLLHYEDILSKSEQFHYNKKELGLLKKKADRLNVLVGGIRNLAWPVGAVVVVDVKKEHVCVKEAIAMGIPIVALVDTNSDPSHINHVIPGNDDAPRSIEILVDYLAKAVARGQAVAASRPKEELAMVETMETLHDFGFEPEEDEEAKKRSPGGAGRRPTRRPAGGGGGARPRQGARPGAPSGRPAPTVPADARREERAPAAAQAQPEQPAAATPAPAEPAAE
jgi:small subunit ribosomal protein S2